MVVVNAFLVNATKEDKEQNPEINYFGYVFGNVSFGETKENVIANLEEALKILVDHARENPNATLTDQTLTDIVVNGLDLLLLKGEDYFYRSREIEEYGITMHVYDLKDIDLKRNREVMKPIKERKYVRIV